MKNPFLFLAPFAFSLFAGLTYLLSYWLVGFVFPSVVEALGGILAFLLGLIFEFGIPISIFAFAVPFYCVVYGANTFSAKKFCFLFALYNAAVLALCCLFAIWIMEENLRYAIPVFLWSAFWSVIPFLLKRQ